MKPFTVKKTRVLFKNNWFHVREETIVSPEGAEIPGILALEFPEWVNIVALTPRKEILLEKQYRHGMATITTETPSGSVEKSDDSFESAARREFSEETGFKPGQVIYLGKSQANPHLMNNHIHHFLFLNCERDATIAPEAELDILTLPFEDALKQIRSGSLNHGYSVEGILRAADHLRNT